MSRREAANANLVSRYRLMLSQAFLDKERIHFVLKSKHVLLVSRPGEKDAVESRFHEN
jgi:hypothetical protein